ncbi:DUF1217 domain-containing protein [Rhizobium sp. CECT 9324]|uniref:DUF1217 domain-containing protein n=1 Tax=Rhizobium sp. CECT 9324 TaxID=2845820 RepID=UPI001E28A4D6|nr:DUF1217 domain-containing protein [Rhizobium sp. CECT 9324]CAH0339765.1 hypothetical protein RHI9324_01416 [Rhizobium sp. CECT 9324]
MVSTYLSYDLATRDMKSSLNRVASDSQVARETAYFEENIGNVTSVDEFLDDYRLYSFAMKAHGLEEMTYAKAYMKKVLESDLSESSSFANVLSDDRYRNFAAAFQFTGQTKDSQTSAQETKLLALLDEQLVAENDAIETETYYYESVIDTVTSADNLVKNTRLFNYVLDAYGIDGTYYTKEHFTKILTSDLSDSASYVNQLVENDASNSAAFLKLAQAFSFNTDGSLSGTTAQTADQKESTVGLYIEEEQTYASEYYLQREKAYYTAQIANVTTVEDITGDERLFNYVKTALELDGTVTASVFKSIVTSDVSASGNYAITNGGSAWVAVAQKFNFGTDGNVKTGYSAQGSAQLASTNTGFAEFYDDESEELKASSTSYFTEKMAEITSVDDILDNSSLRLMLQRAFGFEADEFSNSELRKALTSDITDPNSYANKSRDSRLIEMATLFNFDSEGDAKAPLQAQNQATATNVAKDYIVKKILYLEGDEQTTAKEAATKESEYYQEQIATIRTVDELLADRRVVDVVLGAFGFDGDEVTDDFLKQLFASDLDDPKSFANQQANTKWAEMLASFNFDSEGNLTDDTVGTVQQRGETLETINLYLRQTFEEIEGESNQGVRLALYFERTAPTLTDAYDLIADEALLEVFRTTFGYSEDFSNMDVDMQAKIVEDNITLSDFQDPAKMERFLQRYTAMYDTENASYDTSALSILQGSGGGISADLLTSLAGLKY